jgi:phosphate transport system substrate-binding protein
LKKLVMTVSLAALALAGCGQSGGGGGDSAGTRSQIRIVGSSTVYPFATAVAEQFVRNNPQFKAPIIESTGTGAGMKLFCAGVGAQHADIENASRRIKKSEFEDCRKNGVNQVIEVPIGIDGLALIEAATAAQFKLTQTDVYRALADQPFGSPNTAKTWRDVNPSLPALPIRVYGPPTTSGTRDAFAELIMEKGCDSNPQMKALKASDADRHKEICTKVRTDGAYIDATENDNLMVQKVAANPGSIGILGYSFLEENAAKVRGIPIAGIAPTAATIGDLSYPGARMLYLYVKGEHMAAIPGIREYIAEFAKGWGEGGYLTRRGLIPSPAAQMAAQMETARSLKPMDGADLK